MLGHQHFNFAFIWLTSQGVLQQISELTWKVQNLLCLFSNSMSFYFPLLPFPGQCPSGCSLQSRACVAAFHHHPGDLPSGSVHSSVPLLTGMATCCSDKERSNCSPQVWEEGEANESQNSEELTFFLTLLGKDPPMSINSPGYWEHQSLWRYWSLWIQFREVIWNFFT